MCSLWPVTHPARLNSFLNLLTVQNAKFHSQCGTVYSIFHLYLKRIKSRAGDACAVILSLSSSFPIGCKKACIGHILMQQINYKATEISCFVSYFAKRSGQKFHLRERLSLHFERVPLFLASILYLLPTHTLSSNGLVLHYPSRLCLKIHQAISQVMVLTAVVRRVNYPSYVLHSKIKTLKDLRYSFWWKTCYFVNLLSFSGA